MDATLIVLILIVLVVLACMRHIGIVLAFVHPVFLLTDKVALLVALAIISFLMLCLAIIRKL